MKTKKEQILDKVTAEIRNQKVDPAAVSAAADRVWARVSAAAGATEFQLPAADRIEGCADFQSLIPAHLAGKLSEARSLLLVDHTHECIPCRKAMNEARSRRSMTVKPAVSKPALHAPTCDHALGHRRRFGYRSRIAGNSVRAKVLALRPV